MLNKGNKILPDLKDHEVQPPSFLFDRIMQKIEEEDDAAFKKLFAPLGNHSISPKDDLFTENIQPQIKLKDLSTDRLKALKDHKIAPPLGFEKMLSGAKEAPQKTPVFPLKEYSRRIAAAVAVIILGGVAYFIYQNKQAANTLKDAGHSIASNPAPPVDKPQLTDTLSTAPQPAGPATVPQSNNTNLAAARTANPRKKLEIPASFYAGKFTPAISIDGSQFIVKDNDYLATFTSFTEESMPPFLRAAKPVATAVTVDKYTSITISEGMAAILKKTYKTRKNGKPTRRARKQKEKIEKWKKADADYFNQNSTNNPLDPMDLGDFILYK